MIATFIIVLKINVTEHSLRLRITHIKNICRKINRHKIIKIQVVIIIKNHSQFLNSLDRDLIILVQILGIKNQFLKQIPQQTINTI